MGDELVRFASIICRLNGFRSGAGPVPFSSGKKLVGPAHPLPPVVPVHGVVSPGHGGDSAHAESLDGFLQRLEIGRRAPGRRIAAVQDGVYQDAIAGQAPAPGHFEQRQVMLLGAVDQSVRRESQQVQPAFGSPKPFHDFDECGVLVE